MIGMLRCGPSNLPFAATAKLRGWRTHKSRDFHSIRRSSSKVRSGISVVIELNVGRVLVRQIQALVLSIPGYLE